MIRGVVRRHPALWIPPECHSNFTKFGLRLKHLTEYSRKEIDAPLMTGPVY
jgi:hypothetical protein